MGYPDSHRPDIHNQFHNLIMKRIAVILFFVCQVFYCSAQDGSRRSLEFELGIGILQSFDKLIFEHNQPGACPYAEIRYVFNNSPIDIGLNTSAQIFSRTSENEKLDFMSYNILAVADYSFLQTFRNRAYIGIGGGLSSFEWDHGIVRVGPNRYSSPLAEYSRLCIMPRIGVAIHNHLNVSISYLIEDSANSNLNLRLGYVF